MTTENFLGQSCFSCKRPVPDDAAHCGKCKECHCHNCISWGTDSCLRCDGVVGAVGHQRTVAAKEALDAKR
jgi:hypothetical protein